MDNSDFRKLIAKLIDGSIDHGEYTRLMDYLARHDFEREVFHDEGLVPMKPSMSSAEQASALSRVQRRIGIKPPKRAKRFWLPVAAAAVLFIVVRLVFDPAMELWDERTENVGFLTKTVPNGKRDSLVFADGSKIWINSGSIIDYPIEQHGSIIVRLKGEAFFDIAQNKRRHFVVETGNIRTSVLGTAFNIYAHDSSAVDVTVVRGRVRVDNGGKRLAVLGKDQQISYQSGGSSVVVNDVDAALSVAWLDDRLVFRDVRVAQAVDVLSRRFGVSFSIDDRMIANCVFSASFERGESLAKVLEVIGRVNGIEFQQNGKAFNLRGTGCP